MPARTDTNPATTSKSNSERAEKTPRYLFNLSPVPYFASMWILSVMLLRVSNELMVLVGLFWPWKSA